VTTFLSSIVGYFLTWWGAFVLAALDSSVFVFTPMGPDALVIYLAARDPDRFWLYALLTTAGSTFGAAITYWMGRKFGEAGLTRFASTRRLEQVRQRATGTGSLMMVLPAALPPPFPLTAFVLTCGALELSASRLFAVFAGTRLLRFGAEAMVARRYGAAVLRLLKSPIVQVAVGALALAIVIGSIVVLVPILRRSRRPRKRAD